MICLRTVLVSLRVVGSLESKSKWLLTTINLSLIATTFRMKERDVKGGASFACRDGRFAGLRRMLNQRIFSSSVTT